MLKATKFVNLLTNTCFEMPEDVITITKRKSPRERQLKCDYCSHEINIVDLYTFQLSSEI